MVTINSEKYITLFSRKNHISTLGTLGNSNINMGNKFNNFKNQNIPMHTASNPE